MTAEATAAIKRRLADDSPAVRVAAAEALARVGHVDLVLPALAAILRSTDRWAAVQAADVLDRLGDSSRPVLPTLLEIQAALEQATGRTPGPNSPDLHVRALVGHLVGVLDGTVQPLVYQELR